MSKDGKRSLKIKAVWFYEYKYSDTTSPVTHSFS